MHYRVAGLGSMHLPPMLGTSTTYSPLHAALSAVQSALPWQNASSARFSEAAKPPTWAAGFTGPQ